MLLICLVGFVVYEACSNMAQRKYREAQMLRAQQMALQEMLASHPELRLTTKASKGSLADQNELVRKYNDMWED